MKRLIHPIGSYLIIGLYFGFITGLSSCSSGNKQSKLAFQAEATTGEGSIWHPERQSLFWVDIEGKRLYEFLPKEKRCNTWDFGSMISTVVPESKTSMVVALQNEIIRLNVENGTRHPVASIDDKYGKNRCNDGKCDPSGRLWVGTMGFDGQTGAASLFRVTPDGRVTKMIDSVTISNGLVWTADKQYMYYIDTPTRQIARYRYNDDTGEISFDGIAVKIPDGCGSPDGMTIDNRGNLWVAHWGGYGVYCWDPQTGKLLQKIDVPVPHVASCAFGGKNLDVLYITTARAGLSKDMLEKYPLSGSLFVCKPGAQGVKANYFGRK